METAELIHLAIAAREAAYAPYSQFAVGAALLTKSGAVFSGCNIENISFSLTICAERAAVTNAVTAGHRDFSEIVIVADGAEPVSPCGACRQVLAEFAPALEIVCANLKGDIFESSLAVLLPRAKTGILQKACST